MCGGWFEIRTNPKESEYEVVEGARRKIEGFVPEEGEVIPKKGMEHLPKQETRMDRCERSGVIGDKWVL